METARVLNVEITEPPPDGDRPLIDEIVSVEKLRPVPDTVEIFAFVPVSVEIANVENVPFVPVSVEIANVENVEITEADGDRPLIDEIISVEKLRPVPDTVEIFAFVPVNVEIANVENVERITPGPPPPLYGNPLMVDICMDDMDAFGAEILDADNTFNVKLFVYCALPLAPTVKTYPPFTIDPS